MSRLSVFTRSLVVLQLALCTAFIATSLLGVLRVEEWTVVSFAVCQVIAAILCFTRAATEPRERLAWICFGLALTSWILSIIAFRFFITMEDGEIPIPSLADVFYLAFFPFAYAGLWLLLRDRVHDFRPSMWFDGVIAALGTGAVAAAIVLERAVSGGIGGPTLETFTVLAYPVGDLILIAGIAAALAITGLRGSLTWIILAIGLFGFVLSDAIYLFVFDSYVLGSPTDFGWVLGSAMIGFASLTPASKVRVRLEHGAVAPPILFGLIGCAVLVIGQFRHINDVAVVLAAACVATVMGRLWLTARENAQLLRSTHERSVTDALTGLGNRRMLISDLDEALGDPETTLILMDLNGFKTYNDSFGHTAGDELLARLGAGLRAAVDDCGAAYRMGGDEFCALIRPDPAELDDTVASITESLSERGEAFEVTSAWGTVRMDEGSDRGPVELLGIVDRRMYAQKNSSRPSARRMSVDTLALAIEARHPATHTHSQKVAESARSLGQSMHLSGEVIDQIVVVSELHAVGKIAIPDSILEKPSGLSAAERRFIERHTAIGAHILDRAPALASISPLVRATHEWFDGTGYPDGLAGTEIPIESRVVSVCNAFDAMTSERPYRMACSTPVAIAELRANSGTQFDPELVDGFIKLVTERLALAA
jgi:diguanylate cyclase (GGDEF)-like protein